MPKQVQSDLEKIRERLGHFDLHWHPQHWLDTGFPEVNAILGDPNKGLCYGKIIEISGLYSHGKTAMALVLASLAQRDKAKVTWLDFETSWDPEWAKQRSLNESGMVLIQPYVGKFKSKKKKGKEDEGTGKVPKSEERLSTAEDLCAEADMIMDLSAKTHKKQILIVDSVASMLVAVEEAGGVENQSMYTNYGLSTFLGKLMRRWVGKAQAYSVLIILLNQLRRNTSIRFGDQWDTVGGEAIRFYAHARARVKRTGKMTDKSKMIGFKALMINKKSKFGAEGAEVGFKYFFGGPIEFCPAEEVKYKEDK